MSEEKDETPIELSLEMEPLPETSEEDCLPCQALDRLCSILPEEDGRKACEEIKIGLENETMTAEEAREYLASKVGMHVLATKLSEVSDWITEQEIKRQEITENIVESIPLEEEPILLEKKLPPLPEQMTKPMDEIAPLDLDTIPEVDEEVIPEKVDKSVKSASYNSDDDIIYDGLFDTDIEDDPLYVYDDTDLWLEDGLYEEEDDA